MTNHLHDALFAPLAARGGVFLELDGGSEMTHRAFDAEAAHMAHALRGLGVGVGDRVVVQAPKTARMLVLYAACVRAGAVLLPLNTAYTGAEVAYFARDAEPALLVCETERLAEMQAIAGGAAVATLDADGTGTLAHAMEGRPDAFDPVPRGPDDLAALLYTSGTTGRSKGAMLSHENLVSNARTLTELWRITAADRLIHALPIFHTHGLFVAMNTALIAGARVRLMARFDADAVLSEMPRSTLMMGVPTFYTRLLSDARLTREAGASMRLFVSGSAPLLAQTHRDWEARTGHRILERYGMTETNMITSNPYEGERRAGTVGMPLPGVEVRLAEVADGIGAIEVRGPNVFRGYWRMPEKTAEELGADGWFVTGDLGRVSADGYLSIVGRAKDLVITGGYNVYPKEIEDLLDELEGVAESAVFGIPDADFGEAIVAAVVPAPGWDEDAARAHVEARLARFKHPRRYEVMEALPRNAMGKVQKAALRETFAR